MNERSIPNLIGSLGPRLESLCRFLERSGFAFQYPEEVLPGPEKDLEDTIARIEREAGVIPEAVKHFHRAIGGVNLNGHHEAWQGCDYPDALIVFPLEFALVELDDFVADRDEYRSVYGSFRIPVAPDFYHKEGVSGGMWYGIPVPSKNADPPLLEEPHSTTFLRYIEIALKWGGFPGLEHADAGQTWPLEALQHSAGV